MIFHSRELSLVIFIGVEAEGAKTEQLILKAWLAAKKESLLGALPPVQGLLDIDSWQSVSLFDISHQ